MRSDKFSKKYYWQ